MRRAALHFLWRPPFNGPLFAAGLARCGFKISSGAEKHPTAKDVLVLWNRRLGQEHLAQRYEAVGAPVVILENGYFGRNAPGGPWYAIAKGQHNGVGEWPAADPHRWQRMGLATGAWRTTNGTEIVVLAQRGIGSAQVREPDGWLADALIGLAQRTNRPIRVRKHPGPQGAVPNVPLEQELATAYAAVTWGSSAALKALALGVPVFHGLPRWIGANAARPLAHSLEDRFLGDPSAMWHRLATALWNAEEIASGEPFARLLP